VKTFYEPAILIGVRNTILIVDALSEFSHSLRDAVFSGAGASKTRPLRRQRIPAPFIVPY